MAYRELTAKQTAVLASQGATAVLASQGAQDWPQTCEQIQIATGYTGIAFTLHSLRFRGFVRLGKDHKYRMVAVLRHIHEREGVMASKKR